jgi:hypothetical protein
MRHEDGMAPELKRLADRPPAGAYGIGGSSALLLGDSQRQLGSANVVWL